MERFLYRLSRSPHGRRFVLKGALMFVVWQAPRSRPTMDIDLASLGACDGEEIQGLLRSCCVQPVEPDGLEFDPASLRSTAIFEQARYVGLRCRLSGALGVERVTVQIDVAAGSPGERPSLVGYPTLLDQPAPRLLGCSRKIAVAEKLHAIVSGGEINTRLKDFYDLWLLSRHFRFDGEVLSRAVRSVFRDRDTAISGRPIGLTARFGSDQVRQVQWAAFVRKRLLEGAPRDLAEVVDVVAAFLGPLVEALGERGFLEGVWLPGGPWQDIRPAAVREPRATWSVQAGGAPGGRSSSRRPAEVVTRLVRAEGHASGRCPRTGCAQCVLDKRTPWGDPFAMSLHPVLAEKLSAALADSPPLALTRRDARLPKAGRDCRSAGETGDGAGGQPQ
jgi:hypothetical protein